MSPEALPPTQGCTMLNNGPQPRSTPADENRGRYRRILRYVLPYSKTWIAIIAATVLSSALTLLQPLPIKVLVDNVFGGRELPSFLGSMPSWLTSGAMGGLTVALATLAIYFLGTILEIVLVYGWVKIGQRMVYDVAEDLMARIQRRSLIFHTKNAVGDLMGRITGDSWCVYKLVDLLLFAPANAILLILGMTIVLWQMSPSLTLVALAVAPIMAGATVLFRKPLRDASRAQREIDSQIQSHVQRILSGIPVVQLFVQEEREHRQFVEFSDQAIRVRWRGTFVGSWASLCNGLVGTLGTALILWLGARQVLQGTLTLGGLTVYLGYLGTLQNQFKVFTTTYSTLQSARASIDRVAEILEVKPEVHDGPHARPLEGVRGHVRIEDVTFGYDQGREVLHQVSFEAKPGEVVAVVGPTGAGKSTVLGLVLRLFDPWTGRVTIDGQDLRDVTVTSVRANVAIVLQESFLFPMTITQNIEFGKPGASREQIIEAAKIASAHEFISQLPGGYDTLLGQRGATLSGGERQRISIARAILKDAPILILDEPTSNLDAITDHQVLSALSRLRNGKTVLLIAHRLDTVRRADRIFALEQGRIVECGSHDELVGQNGLYSRLHRIQEGLEVSRA